MPSSVTASAKIISAPAATYACARSMALLSPSLASASVRAMITNCAVRARIHGGFHAVHHLFGGNQLLSRPVAAALLAHLVLDVHRRHARLDLGREWREQC